LSFGIDHSSTPPDPAKLVAAGVHFVCRYLSTPGNPKNLTLAEAAALKLHQIDVVLVFETVAKEALKGQAAGVADAKSARQQAAVCGLPHAPIYFAVDFDETPQEASVVHDYVAGAASVLGYDKTGGYGGYWVVKRLLDAKVCKYAWQTYAWSGGQWDVRAQLRQYLNGQKLAGISVDFDHSMFPDYGQARPPSPLKDAAVLKAERGYWAWVQWRLGEDDWAGYTPAAPAVRPDVPKLISDSWWVALARFLAARKKA